MVYASTVATQQVITKQSYNIVALLFDSKILSMSDHAEHWREHTILRNVTMSVLSIFYCLGYSYLLVFTSVKVIAPTVFWSVFLGLYQSCINGDICCAKLLLTQHYLSLPHNSCKKCSLCHLGLVFFVFFFNGSTIKCCKKRNVRTSTLSWLDELIKIISHSKIQKLKCVSYTFQ